MPRLLWTSADAGSDSQRAPELGGRGGRVAGVEQKVGQVVVRTGKVGLELQRLLVGVARLRPAVLAPGAPCPGCCTPARNPIGTRSRDDNASSRRRAAARACSATPRLFSVTACIHASFSSGQFAMTAVTAIAASALMPARNRACPNDVRERRQSSGGEQHQEGHQRKAISREDVEDDDARGVGRVIA